MVEVRVWVRIIFFIDIEEENMKNRSGFKNFGPIHISLEFFKVKSKFDPVIVL
jgi:hypothetical protein